MTCIDGAIALFGAEPTSARGAWLIARGPLLVGMFVFLVLTLMRGVAGLFPRPVVAEAWGRVGLPTAASSEDLSSPALGPNGSVGEPSSESRSSIKRLTTSSGVE